MMISISKDLLTMAAKKRQDLLIGVNKQGDVKVSLMQKPDQEKLQKLLKFDGIKLQK
jgi:hypothetical protein